MGWLTELTSVYDRILENKRLNKKPLPLYHISNNAPLEITLNENGEFSSAKLLGKSEKADWQTCMPCTEQSASRTSGVEAYPFCDKLEYVAGDYEKHCAGKELQAKHAAFVENLEKWASSEYSNLKIKSVYTYVQKGSLINDLFESNIPELKTPDTINEWGDFVRWNVIIPGDIHSQTWQDPEIHQLWIDYYLKTCSNPKAFCYVTGNIEQIAKSHSKKIRHSGDGAKLISSNDKTNYTFRGRFTDADEACQISMAVSGKAHNALRWLIDRQGTVVGNDLTVVAWCSAPDVKPRLLESSHDSWLEEEEDEEPKEYSASEESAKAIKNRLLGYYGELTNSDKILVMALNAATPGRLSLLLYREFSKSEFCEAQEYWHSHLAWFYTYWVKGEKTSRRTISAPSPEEIAKAAYGEHISSNVKAMTIQRLLSCIIDKKPIPRDVEQLCFNRASRPNTLEKSELEKTLETACAVIKYNLFAQKEEDFTVGLDENQKDRDYLYGRLLAVADKVETVVLEAREENRQSNAVRYMQRFARYPYSTWNYIYTDKLQPYLKYLKQMQPGLYGWYEGIIQDISDKFVYDDFISDESLSGKFLLGYHCQQKDFWRKREKNQPVNEKDGD